MGWIIPTMCEVCRIDLVFDAEEDLYWCPQCLENYYEDYDESEDEEEGGDSD